METYYCDILCIGGGAAGIAASVAAAKHGVRVCLVTKDLAGSGNTRLAGGIVASACSVPQDSALSFFSDMLEAGCYLNNPSLVRALVNDSRESNLCLENWGHIFRRDAWGKIGGSAVTQASGHSFARTLMCGYKGISLAAILRSAVARRAVNCREYVFVLKLVKSGNKVLAAVCFDLVRGECFLVRAQKFILASGGAGMLFYPLTDNTRFATGDGFALAFELGLRLVDMEQIQWLPFAVAKPGQLRGINCGDPSYAGPHGVLLNNKGETVLSNLQAMPRSAVTTAIALEVQKGGALPGGGLLLDQRGNLRCREGRELLQLLQERGVLDVVRDAYGSGAYRWEEPFEVMPTQHFCCGGITTDENGLTGISNLYAIGEVAGGVHGADRLGSVALNECLVFGGRAGIHAAKGLVRERTGAVPLVDTAVHDAVTQVKGLPGRKGAWTPSSLKSRLSAMMVQNVGCSRDFDGLTGALQEIAEIRRVMADTAISPGQKLNKSLLDYFELQMMLQTAEMIISSALARKESRGSHYRRDYPHRDSDLDFCNVFVFCRPGGVMQTEMIKGEAFAD
jgi:fumarate reductase (CoM/CoB) subunit A